MEKKYLGKIIYTGFGIFEDTDDIGLKLTLHSKERATNTFITDLKRVERLLNDADCNYTYELLNKPIEMVFENNVLKSFRILTEVL